MVDNPFVVQRHHFRFDDVTPKVIMLPSVCFLLIFYAMMSLLVTLKVQSHDGNCLIRAVP